jgi:holo-[acyl-carrier protein] synthase
MIVGVGIDIIEVDRIGEKIGKGKGLREKIFSPGEIAFCESRSNKGQHYAARFAAKEAFLKAIGTGLTLSHELHEIEVRLDALGKPGIGLTGAFLALAIKNNWNKIHLSLSHVKAMACAVVILEQ